MKSDVIQSVVTRRRRESPGSMPSSTVDVERLEAALRRQIQGEVRFDDGSRALYAADASNYRQVPIGVVIPRDVSDVIKTVSICHEYRAPVLARGGGTSLAGQTCNVAVVMDLSKYINEVIEIDPQRRFARVQSGTILDDLRQMAEQNHLTFGPDPATHNHCTFGGMIGNDSCGTHSLMAGKTVDNVEELDILTYDGVCMRVGRTSEDELERIIAEGGRRGEVYASLKSLRDKYADLIRERYPHIPRRVSGYNLDQLLPEKGFHVARALVGTEGTCVTILEATVCLVESPPARQLLVLGYPDISSATDHIMDILAYEPIALEGMDDHLIEDMRKRGQFLDEVALLPSGGGWLLVEFGGNTKQEAHQHARRLMDELKKQARPPKMKLYSDPSKAERVWSVREAALGITGIVPGEKAAWPGWEDSAVPPDKVGSYLRDLRGLLKNYEYRGSFYGHFGQGCIHVRISFDLESSAGIRKFRAFMNEAADLVLKYGGSLSGEHGDGQARAELLPKMYGDELVEAFRQFKAIWDPDGKMNPGKIVDPYRIDENLRLGTTYRPAQARTHFSLNEDNGSFSRATLRCIGIGKCRRLEGGTMCPSFMVTREEKHSTRGRARLLFEMLQGNPLKDGWRSKAVKDALDLCLSCKGCKGDCPVNVDMATYKSEFLAHYYKRRLRPMTAYAMGLIFWWARLASLMPGMANFLTQTPMLSYVAKILGGIAPQREIPAFAPQTFQQWFRQRGSRNEGSSRVILWPDTFNNYFYPETSIAAVEILEAAGYQVEVPLQALCCGRPLYDYGMLDLAKSVLRQVLVSLRQPIADGVPLIGLEPSCVAVFRDEMINLFPHDEDAKRLSYQTFLLSEFLVQEGWNPPERPQEVPPHRKAIVHGHCHHKAVMKMNAEEAVLAKLGLNYQVLDSGCCGMAGAFGFERNHYDVSIKIGERVLLPAVREASTDTLIIADGFSCREQIAQTTDRRALHLAEVIHMEMYRDQNGEVVDYPETMYTRSNQERFRQSQMKRLPVVILGAGGLMATGIVAWILRKK